MAFFRMTLLAAFISVTLILGCGFDQTLNPESKTFSVTVEKTNNQTIYKFSSGQTATDLAGYENTLKRLVDQGKVLEEVEIRVAENMETVTENPSSPDSKFDEKKDPLTVKVPFTSYYVTVIIFIVGVLLTFKPEWLMFD